MIAALLLFLSGCLLPRRQRWPRGVVVMAALLLWSGAHAQTASVPASADAEVQPIPPLSGRVIDHTGDTLSVEQQQALSHQLAEVEAQTGSQMVVLLVKRTAPEDIAAYAWRVADAWKLGRRDVGDGVLIVVARDERRVRIEVAKALEGAIPDLAARQIIDQVLRPAFRSGQYAQGLQATVDALRQRLHGEVPPPEAPATARDDGEAVDGVFLLFVVAMMAVTGGQVLSGLMGRPGASWVSGAVAPVALHHLGASWWMMVLGALVAFAVVRLRLADRGTSLHANPGSSRSNPIIPGGWSGGSNSDSGGSLDSFSSGGGGDFGGGGASGDW